MIDKRSYADRADSATTFDPELQFDIEVDARLKDMKMKHTFMDNARFVYGKHAPIAVAAILVLSLVFFGVVFFVAHKAFVELKTKEPLSWRGGSLPATYGDLAG